MVRVSRVVAGGSIGPACHLHGRGHSDGSGSPCAGSARPHRKCPMNPLIVPWSRICTDVTACALGSVLFFAVSEMRWLALACFAVGLCGIGLSHWMHARVTRTQSESALSTEVADDRHTAARARLQSLREGELSVGAHLRQGKVVERAPGQLCGTRHSGGEIATATRARTSAHMSTDPGSGTGDFTLGMVAGAAAGSLAGGLSIGGSVTGSLVGASLSSSQPASIPVDPSAFDVSSSSASQSAPV